MSSSKNALVFDAELPRGLGVKTDWRPVRARKSGAITCRVMCEGLKPPGNSSSSSYSSSAAAERLGGGLDERREGEWK